MSKTRPALEGKGRKGTVRHSGQEQRERESRLDSRFCRNDEPDALDGDPCLRKHVQCYSPAIRE